MKTAFITFIMIIFAMICLSQSKVADDLLMDIKQARTAGTTVEALIVLNEQFDTPARDLQLKAQKATPHERGVAVVTALMEHAGLTQAELIGYLESRKGSDVISYQAVWITNIIFVEALPDAFMEIALRQDVALLEKPENIESIKPVYQHPARIMPGNAEPGLRAINAHKMWQLGFTGEGVIVGGVDSGVEGTHPALSGNWHGNTVPAAQAWHDPGYGTTFPTDEDGHGTHTTGTMAGLDLLTADTVGVAFGAEWIHGRVIWGPNSTFVLNLQWMLNPDEDPLTTDDMPAVINNSWGDTPESCNSSYLTAIQNLEAAGVAVIFAAGNSGPGPSTIIAPAKSNFTGLQVFSVGAVDGNYDDLPIAPFSSRGPTTCAQGSDQIKPEVSAPGVHVRSSYPGEMYFHFAGTSMATPHVCGAIALLKQAFPDKTGNELKQILYETARDLGEPGEDNIYGMGIIDVYQAYIENAVPENPRPPGQVTGYSDYTMLTSAIITWTDPTTLVSGEPLGSFEINIYKDNILIASVASGTGTFTDTGLTAGQYYEYMLKTRDLVTGNLSIGRQAGVWAGGSPFPASPSNLAGTYAAPGISLTWSDPSTQSDGSPIDDLARIYIYRDQVLLDSVAPGTESYTDNEQMIEQTYSYSLVAADNETPVHFSQPCREIEVFAGTKPAVLVYYGNAFGPSLDYMDSVYRAIRYFGIPVYRTNNLDLFGTLTGYDAIFVITGVYISYSHMMNSAEGYELMTYLNGGGSIYIEGCMVFNSANVMAGAYNLRPWLGLDVGGWTLEPVNNLSGLNEFEGMEFQHPGLGAPWDILNPVTSTSTLWEDPQNGNIYGVYNEYNSGRIIGAVLPFGGMTDTEIPGNKLFLMCKYLEMLGLDVQCYEGVDAPAVQSSEFKVQSYPNPTGGSLQFAVRSSQEEYVTLKIYDGLGREIGVLLEEVMPAGEHTVRWDAGKLPAGIYYYRLTILQASPSGQANDYRLSTGKIVKY